MKSVPQLWMTEAMNYDCVLSYHMNPMTCGVAKFNQVLAAKMGLPFVDMFSHEAVAFSSPLLSVKLSEFTPEDLNRLAAWISGRGAGPYSVFLHGYDQTAAEDSLIRGAEAVFCGNVLLYEQLRRVNANSYSLWCPGTGMDAQPFVPTELRVFSFGMAHKIKADKYHRLKELLDRTGKTYSMYLSTALHEGTSFDTSFNDAFKEMREIFGAHVYFLGYISDQAVFNYLKTTDYFAAFFDNGVRANNTSVHAALAAGSVVITNLDEFSPFDFKHMGNLIDINRTESLPHDPETLAAIRASALELSSTTYSWENLIGNINQPSSVIGGGASLKS